MGKSIFEFGDKFGFESRWEDNWVEDGRAKNDQRNKSNSSASSGIVKFLNTTKLFAIKTDVSLQFKLYGYENWLYSTDYEVSIASSNNSLKLSPKSWTAENGDIVTVTASMDKPAKVKLYINIDGARKYTFEIEFKKSNDVFSLTDIDRLTGEYSYVAQFNNLEEPPNEYEGNYCMQGADRALGKLLNNSSDFYVVERGTHKVKNSINFSTGTGNTYQRAGTMNSKGFIHSTYAIESKFWNVDHNERKLINSKYPPYANARAYAISKMYDIVWVSKSHGTSFYVWLKGKCDTTEPGYHVYYLSIVDGFHTQVLIINNSDRDNPKYEIWDDHGITTSKGKLNDIANGINIQTSSMFTSSCLIRLKNGTSDKWDSQKLKVWKIKKK